METDLVRTGTVYQQISGSQSKRAIFFSGSASVLPAMEKDMDVLMLHNQKSGKQQR